MSNLSTRSIESEYEAVRLAPEPRVALLAFLQSTYGAAAELAVWEKSLSCEIGRKGVPRIFD